MAKLRDYSVALSHVEGADGSLRQFGEVRDLSRNAVRSGDLALRHWEGSMQFYRLYAGDDGQSHFEALDSSKTSEFFNKTRAAKGLLFRSDFAPHIVHYHRAPHRRWVITLSGSVDIGLGDGSRMTFHPGDVFLAEDTTGQGHTATPHDWVRAYVDIEEPRKRD